MAAPDCGPSIQICRLRVTLLDSLGSVADTLDNSYVTDKIVSINASADVETGTQVTATSGCDCQVANYRGKDKLNRFTFGIAYVALEPALIAMMTGGRALLDATETDVIGVAWPDPTDCDTNDTQVALEFWTKHFVGDSQDPVYPWFHHIYPLTVWTPGDQTYENDFAQPALNGFSRQNLAWFGGPYGDGPPDGQSIARGGFFLTDIEPPAAACAYQHVDPGT